MYNYHYKLLIIVLIYFSSVYNLSFDCNPHNTFKIHDSLLFNVYINNYVVYEDRVVNTSEASEYFIQECDS